MRFWGASLAAGEVGVPSRRLILTVSPELFLPNSTTSASALGKAMVVLAAGVVVVTVGAAVTVVVDGPSVLSGLLLLPQLTSARPRWPAGCRTTGQPPPAVVGHY